MNRPTTIRPVLHLWCPEPAWPQLDQALAPLSGRLSVRRHRIGAEPAPGPAGAGLLLYRDLADLVDPTLDQITRAQENPALLRGAVALWSAEAEALLALFRAGRDQRRLLSTAALRETPEAVLALVAALCDLPPPDLPPPDLPISGPPAPASGAVMVAAALRQMLDRVGVLATGLEAAATPLVGPETGPEIGQRRGQPPPQPEAPAPAAVVAALGVEATELRARLAVQEQALATERDRIVALAADVRHRDQRIGLLAEALQGHEAEALALRRSTSWRVTWPLRLVSRGIRRLLPR